MKHTIFTPVYNRANGVLDLAEHINNIEYPKEKFEWLIIDDGSTDNLSEILSQILIQYPDLNIRIIHKSNGGIHTAQNSAVCNAKGEFITRVDSDDYLLPNSLLQKDAALDSISRQQFPSVAGVVGLCLNMRDNTVRGVKFPNDSQITKGYLLRRLGVQGDKNFCMKTSVMREFLIPEFDDTKWVPEGGYLWLEIDKKYDTLFVNIPMAICAEANDGSFIGQMKQKTLSNIMSLYYQSIYIINNGKGYYSFHTLLRAYYDVCIALIHSHKFNNKKYNLRKLVTDVKNRWDRLFILIVIPFISVYDYLRNR